MLPQITALTRKLFLCTILLPLVANRTHPTDPGLDTSIPIEAKRLIGAVRLQSSSSVKYSSPSSASTNCPPSKSFQATAIPPLLCFLK
ncbi:hypothetical protein GALMADRAFT_1210448 [Galerina marginata CBS 339.88]|uniref:Secreted protein n=1 Tax=Galerina marginata (strain CBS 339.88) TaxID=685588 RepID=A0A067S7W8_GALM3|nr:hypothetical protein GALMADRAFT_1210448 [Galerina marginata CBS 339.88]